MTATISPIPCMRKTNAELPCMRRRQNVSLCEDPNLHVRRNSFAYACESTNVRKQNEESPMCANEQNNGAQEEAELISA